MFKVSVVPIKRMGMSSSGGCGAATRVVVSRQIVDRQSGLLNATRRADLSAGQPDRTRARADDEPAAQIRRGPAVGNPAVA
jgi:hypothetical protein